MYMYGKFTDMFFNIVALSFQRFTAFMNSLKLRRSKIESQEGSFALTPMSGIPKQDHSVQCDVCGSYFSCKSSMNRHKRAIHMGSFLYHCSHCGKGFMDLSNLRLHTINKHKGTNKDKD